MFQIVGRGTDCIGTEAFRMDQRRRESDDKEVLKLLLIPKKGPTTRIVRLAPQSLPQSRD